MLIRLMVTNFRSIHEAQELSMVALDGDRAAARHVDALNDPLLTVAALYGANASGKTNVLLALQWLSSAVRDSLRFWDDVVPIDPFRLTNDLASTEFEVDMLVEGVRYSYQLVVSRASVEWEALYSYPARRRRMLFERDGTDVAFGRTVLAGSGVVELLSPQTLALSAAIKLQHPALLPAARRLSQFEVANQTSLGAIMWRRQYLRGKFRPSTLTTRDLFVNAEVGEQLSLLDPAYSRTSPTKLRELAVSLLRFADLGIDDVEVIDVNTVSFADDGEPTRETRKELRFLHAAQGVRYPLAIAQESQGTRTWFEMIGPILWSLEHGRVLLWDELDASLHPRLTARIVELFQDPETNPAGAQLIFSTHDTNLLNYLNRDEVWLTEKGKDGSTSLTGLADFGDERVRRHANLERAYLQGRFGAVPVLDQERLRTAIGVG